MNTDIRISVSFRGHRKRKKLKMILGPGATDYLLDLWIAVAMQRPDGVLIGWDETDIGIESGWESEPNRFVEALISVGFLDRREDGVYVLHDWIDHNPYATGAKARSSKGTFSNLKRWYPAIAAELESKGITSISKEDYQRLTSGHKPNQLPIGDRIGTDSETESDGDRCPNPPSPSPFPPTEEEEGVYIRARETAPSVQPAKPEEPDIFPPGMEPYDLEFLEFWDAYPKQIGQDAAWERWKILKKSKRLPGLAVLLAALSAQAQSERWTSEDGRYIPDPANWLAGGHWKDNLPKVSEIPAHGPRGSPNLQPRTYAQAQDLERRQRAQRLLKGGGHGDLGSNRHDGGQALDTAAQLPERT
ncbi:hypothetical protein [Desulfocurvibacter africanus]|uniref:hypothetical protein n=1 Tax=Desulfocurvibacter africanus TaxID=873 RepID=UPI0005C21193|nr:hypothetical protein [Desulfocurvibacter africanus]